MTSTNSTVQPPRSAEPVVEVTGGVDTHKDTHTAAAVDSAGRVLGSAQFTADGAGYAALLNWLRGFGRLVLVGIEGTGVYGHGLARFLQDRQVPLVEVDRPDRKARRSRASPTRSTPRPLPGPPSPRFAPASPSNATARSRRCGPCASHGAAPSRTGPTCSDVSRRWS